jgi:C-terminal processing protease CtpA/Prc
MAAPTLTATERRAVLDAVLRTVETKFMGPDVDTATLRGRHEAAVIDADSVDAFEAAVNAMLKDLGVSHTGFFHESAPRTAGRVAIAATFAKAQTPDGERWMFQDVHPGGAAAAAGIRPGDILLSVGGKELTPPAATPFTLGERCSAASMLSSPNRWTDSVAIRKTRPGSSSD